MYVSRNMVDVTLMSGRIEHVAEAPPHTATEGWQNMRANIGSAREQASHSVKVSLDTELSRHWTTLNLDHLHFMYLCTTFPQLFQREHVRGISSQHVSNLGLSSDLRHGLWLIHRQ